MQNKAPDSLTDRQKKALPFIVTSPTFTQGCKKAKVDRKTFYRWLDDPAFRSELERQQKVISDRALGMLAQNVTGAIERLAGLVNDKDKRLGRLASKDLLDYHIKFVEIQDIEKRLTAIEERLNK
jgi:hypothetical protein